MIILVLWLAVCAVLAFHIDDEFKFAGYVLISGIISLALLVLVN